MDSFYDALFGLMLGDAIRQEVVGRDDVGEYTIDTCYTVDCGWETAVWKGDDSPMIVVARYATKEEAQEGHSDWCAACLLNPACAWSVQLDEYVNF